jgi:hypothetical protein
MYTLIDIASVTAVTTALTNTRITAGVVLTLLCRDPPRLPERARTVEAAGWLCHRHYDGQGADDLHVEGEDAAQEEKEKLHGHIARVSEVEGSA